MLSNLKPSDIAAGAVILTIGALALPDAIKNSGYLGELRAQGMVDGARQMQLQQSVRNQEKQAEVAEKRYRAGCLMVVALNNPGAFTAITEGRPVFDQEQRKPVPAKGVVCDAYGYTGELQNNDRGIPVVTNIAFTGNRQIVEEARRRVTARYQVPAN